MHEPLKTGDQGLLAEFATQERQSALMACTCWAGTKKRTVLGDGKWSWWWMKSFSGENEARSSKRENRAGSTKTKLVGGRGDLNTAGLVTPQLCRGETHYSHQRRMHKKDFAEARTNKLNQADLAQ
jgi:hypothetical protein